MSSENTTNMSSTDEQNTEAEEVSQPVIAGNAEVSATDAVTEAQPVAAEKRKKARRTTKERTGHNTRGRKTGKVASKVARKAASTTKTRKSVFYCRRVWRFFVPSTLLTVV